MITPDTSSPIGSNASVRRLFADNFAKRKLTAILHIALALALLATLFACGGGGSTTTPPPSPVAPAITAHPQNQTVTAGQTATFSVTATGTAPLTYQWKRDGTAISGATNSSYTTPATATADTGASFTVTVSNSAGNVTSNAATLTVNAAPVAPAITAHPQNQTVTAGQTATFSVTATGTAPLTYQWKKNNATISGATSSSYTTPATTTADNASTFTVTVTNSVNSITSNAATLTVNPAAVAPAITAQPQNQTVTVGQTATFSVTATGTAPLTYQWKKNNATISGATNSSYTTPATVIADNASTFTVTVTNSVNSITSNAATLTVNAALTPDVTVTIDPTTTAPISPYIYGINFYSNTDPPHLTFDRQGGNRWTAYNWENNYSNAGSDYLYQSDTYLSSSTIPGEPVRSFIANDRALGIPSLVTLQLQGYVSADKNGPTSSTGADIATRFKPVVYKKSTVSSTAFTVAPPTTDDNVYMDEFAWALDQKFSGKNIFAASADVPTFISLDNEPDLWASTHSEIQTKTAISSTDLITKTVGLTKALKDQFPDITIFGPANYGWGGIYNWQGEAGAGFSSSFWFADKYLQQMKTASNTYGRRLLDVYDIHWYSEARDAADERVIDLKSSTLNDDQIQAIVQSPRSLWDTTYKEKSWITQWNLTDGIYLLKRLQAKIEVDYPGTKLAVTEYQSGGFNHVAGTIAQADNLGIFGTQGIFAANFWPPSGTYSYALAGFRMFRGFNGANANFGDTSLKSTSSDVSKVAVYTSSDTTTPGRIVIVAINRSNTSQNVELAGLTLSGTATTYRVTATSAQTQVQAGQPVAPVLIGSQSVSGSSWTIALPALSVSTIEIK